MLYPPSVRCHAEQYRSSGARDDLVVLRAPWGRVFGSFGNQTRHLVDQSDSVISPQNAREIVGAANYDGGSSERDADKEILVVARQPVRGWVPQAVIELVAEVVLDNTKGGRQ